MPLGTEVGVGPGDTVLDWDPAPPRKGHSSPPHFGPCLLRPKEGEREEGTERDGEERKGGK